jgi:hypothetical protein
MPHIFGIRHHGPGSARSLLAALEQLKPDVILIEGPPDAQDVLAHAARAEVEPPVALLVYVQDEPQHSVFYPFATFSPEWQAIRWGLSHDVPVRFMDLPQAHRLALAMEKDKAEAEQKSDEPEEPASEDKEAADERTDELRQDPLAHLAQIAGYRDGERWWDHVIESHRGADTEVFQAVRDAMTALREDRPQDTMLEQQREAFMRNTLRAATKEGFERIAVVCGAWHAPALSELPPAAKDNALLKGLPKVKTRAAWVPWSYDRLSFHSGYGAGVASPEWYHLLWQQRELPAVHWMTRAARLMRDQDLDASSAHVIEGVRLAETLATLRGRTLPGLDELMEAALSVLCTGNEIALRLIERKLVIGTRLGKVPEDMPLVPLQEDLTREQKRLRLPVSADHKDYDLDLRKPNDLERSQLLHRLALLGIEWGQALQAQGRVTGTFHEHWRVQWKPEFAIAIIDAARWGTTVADAATGIAADRAAHTDHVDALADLLGQVLLAGLPLAVDLVLKVIEQRAAVARDVAQLMAALPPLVRTRRYGSVRQTDGEVLDAILDGLVTRTCIGLHAACASLDDDAATQMCKALSEVDAAIVVLDHGDQIDAWRGALGQLAEQSGLHAVVGGRVARLLHDAHVATAEQTGRRLHLALSQASDPLAAAHWVEGFLSGSGLVLLHDEALWSLIDGWISQLNAEHFTETLPLLRRTFATFQPGERRQMGERARHGAADLAAGASTDFDHERAMRVLPVLQQIFGERA